MGAVEEGGDFLSHYIEDGNSDIGGCFKCEIEGDGGVERVGMGLMQLEFLFRTSPISHLIQFFPFRVVKELF